MQEYRKDEIIYDEDWRSFDEPMTAEVVDDDVPNESSISEKDNKKKEKKPVSLIGIQLVICIIIAILIFMLKAMDGETYNLLCNWYEEQMKNTLVSSKKFEDIDLSKYFEATLDQKSSTFDES
ncbi:MAG: hypothetical protein IJ015_02260 [Ruminococcus sp.]|nr:hypothetical protein [Ruminococcus sp.]